MQVGKSQLIDNIKSEIVDNSTGQISPRDVRHNLVDIIDSVHLFTADSDLNALNFATPDVRTTRAGSKTLSKLHLQNYSSIDNSAFGYSALAENYNGQRNTAIGSHAMGCNLYGSSNTALGFNTLAGNVFGSGNVAVGNFAIQTNKHGDFNIAIGHGAGYYIGENSSYKFYVGSHPVDEDVTCSNTTGSGLTPLMHGDLQNLKLGVGVKILHDHGSLQVAGDISPSGDCTSNLGHSSYRFNNLYLCDSINDLTSFSGGYVGFGGHAVPKVTDTHNLGSEDLKWNTGYFNNIRVSGTADVTTYNYKEINSCLYECRTLFLATSGDICDSGAGPCGYLNDEQVERGGFILQSSGADYRRDYEFIYQAPDTNFKCLEQDTPYSRSSWNSNISLVVNDGSHVQTDRLLGRNNLSVLNTNCCYGMFIQKDTPGIRTDASGVDERQVISVDATSGTFTVSFDGQTTEALPYNITPEAMQIALEALSSIGSGNVTVFGGSPSNLGVRYWDIRFTGTLKETNLAQMTTDCSSLSKTTDDITITRTIPGQNHKIRVITDCTEGEWRLIKPRPIGAGGVPGVDRYSLAIPCGATTTQVRDAITGSQLFGYDDTNITVTYSTGITLTATQKAYDIEFVGNKAKKDQSAGADGDFEFDSYTLTGGGECYTIGGDDEIQIVTITATGGTFRLEAGFRTTEDNCRYPSVPYFANLNPVISRSAAIPFDATAQQVKDALIAGICNETNVALSPATDGFKFTQEKCEGTSLVRAFGHYTAANIDDISVTKMGSQQWQIEWNGGIFAGKNWTKLQVNKSELVGGGATGQNPAYHMVRHHSAADGFSKATIGGFGEFGSKPEKWYSDKRFKIKFPLTKKTDTNDGITGTAGNVFCTTDWLTLGMTYSEIIQAMNKAIKDTLGEQVGYFFPYMHVEPALNEVPFGDETGRYGQVTNNGRGRMGKNWLVNCYNSAAPVDIPFIFAPATYDWRYNASLRTPQFLCTITGKGSSHSSYAANLGMPIYFNSGWRFDRTDDKYTWGAMYTCEDLSTSEIITDPNDDSTVQDRISRAVLITSDSHDTYGDIIPLTAVDPARFRKSEVKNKGEWLDRTAYHASDDPYQDGMRWSEAYRTYNTYVDEQALLTCGLASLTGEETRMVPNASTSFDPDIVPTTWSWFQQQREFRGDQVIDQISRLWGIDDKMLLVVAKPKDTEKDTDSGGNGPNLDVNCNNYANINGFFPPEHIQTPYHCYSTHGSALAGEVWKTGPSTTEEAVEGEYLNSPEGHGRLQVLADDTSIPPIPISQMMTVKQLQDKIDSVWGAGKIKVHRATDCIRLGDTPHYPLRLAPGVILDLPRSIDPPVRSEYNAWASRQRGGDIPWEQGMTTDSSDNDGWADSSILYGGVIFEILEEDWHDYIISSASLSMAAQVKVSDDGYGPDEGDHIDLAHMSMDWNQCQFRHYSHQRGLLYWRNPKASTNFNMYAINEYWCRDLAAKKTTRDQIHTLGSIWSQHPTALYGSERGFGHTFTSKIWKKIDGDTVTTPADGKVEVSVEGGGGQERCDNGSIVLLQRGAPDQSEIRIIPGVNGTPSCEVTTIENGSNILTEVGCANVTYFTEESNIKPNPLTEDGKLTNISDVNFLASSGDSNYAITYAGLESDMTVGHHMVSQTARSPKQQTQGKDNVLGFHIDYKDENRTLDHQAGGQEKDRLFISAYDDTIASRGALTLMRNPGIGFVGINDISESAEIILPETIFNIQSTGNAIARVASLDSSYKASVQILNPSNKEQHGFEIEYSHSTARVDMSVFDNYNKKSVISIDRASKNIGLHTIEPNEVLTISSGVTNSATISIEEQLEDPSVSSQYGKVYVKPKNLTSQSQSLYFKDDEGNVFDLIFNAEEDKSLVYTDANCNTYAGDTPDSRGDILPEQEHNTAVGCKALYDVTTGDYNTAVGSHAGQNVTTGSNSVFFGYNAGGAMLTGTNNVLLGDVFHTSTSSDLSHSILIGNGNLGGGSSPVSDYTFLLGDTAENILLRGTLGPNFEDRHLYISQGSKLSLESIDKTDLLTLSQGNSGHDTYIEKKDTAGNTYPEGKVSFVFTGDSTHPLLTLSHKEAPYDECGNWTPEGERTKPFAELKGDMFLSGGIHFCDGSQMSSSSGILYTGGIGINSTLNTTTGKTDINLDINKLSVSSSLSSLNSYVAISTDGTVEKTNIDAIGTLIDAGRPRIMDCDGGAGQNHVFTNTSTIDSTTCGATFIGYRSGDKAANCDYTNFLGYEAGSHESSTPANAVSSSAYSVFIGERAGWEVSSADHSIFIGHRSGYQADSSRLAIFIGDSAGKNASSPRSVGIGDNALEGVTGSENIEITAGTGGSNRIIGNGATVSSKLAIGTCIAGDMSTKKVSIGNASLTPDAVLEVKANATTDTRLQEWKDEAGNVVAYLTRTGDLFIDGTVSSF